MVRPALTSTLTLVALGALGGTPASAIVAPGPKARPDLDRRAGERAPVPATVAGARTTLAKGLGAEGIVSGEPVTGGLRVVRRTDGMLTGRSGADPATVALDYVRAHLDAFGLDGADLRQLRLVARTTADGITHLVWSQAPGGVPAYDSGLFADVTRDGRLVGVGGAPVHDLAPPSTHPPLGPGAARAAAQRDLGVPLDNAHADIGTDAQHTTHFDGGDTARLVVLADPGGDRLAWRLIVAGPKPFLYDMLVDAATGEILTRHSLTDFAVWADVLENHPYAAGPAAAGTPRAVDVSSYFATTTPTTLSGKYVHAYADVNHNDIADASEEVAPSGGDFQFSVTPVTPAAGQACPTAISPSAPCTWDGAAPSTAAANRAQVTTQVFYFASRFHDWLANSSIAFTSSNFEGAEAVRAETDDGGGSNNANMSTPPVGSAPRMQMYLFNAPFPAVSGGDDASVVYHEYTHGLSNRLVGGDGQADGLQERQSAAMGEGWSDWYAMDFLTDQGLLLDTPTPGDQVVGAYVTGDPHVGIRFNAIDCPVGATSVSCPGSAPAGPGGFTFADLGRVAYAGDAQHPYFEVHSDGEIWAETLWDLRRALGGDTARKLITEGMRLSPKQPSFLDMRDAILAADAAVDGGADHAAIWAVFAGRGMGYGASTASANATRGVASFQVPPLLSATAPDATSLDLGASGTVAIAVTNPAGVPVTGVHATLASSTAGVTVPAATADLGTLAAGATASPSFTVAVGDAVACGASAGLTLSLSSDQGARSIPLSIPIGAGRATATRIYPVPLAIPDDDPAGGITSAIAIGTHGRVGRLRVTLTAAHPYVGDLHAWLTSPSGTTVDLMEEPGATLYGSGANLVATNPITFDDDAVADIQDVDDTDDNLAGAYRSDEPLHRFAGEDRYGTWTLRVVDDYQNDVGALSGWSLETDDPACAVTEAPSGTHATSATLGARVDPGSSAATVAFDYGTTTAYGARVTAGALAASAGPAAVTAALSGLAPATTYHYRVVALRGGTVIATGQDRTVTTSATDAPAADPTAPPAAPLAAPPVAPWLGRLPRTLRSDAHGRVRLTLSARPAGATGRLTVIGLSGVRGRLATKAFSVPATGTVKVWTALPSKARAYLRRHRTLKTRLTVVLGSRTFRATATLRRR